MVDNLFLFNKVDINDECEPNYLGQKRTHLKQSLYIRYLPDGLKNVINPVRRSYLFIERILLENRRCNETSHSM